MKKRIISFATSLALIGSVIAPINALADEEETVSFSGDGYTVTYEVKSSWEHNQNVEVTITNTSEEPLLNWALQYDTHGQVNGIWNGVIFDSYETSYIIKNSEYNYEILPENSVTFGYTLSGDYLDVPENISLCSQREIVDAESYSVSLSVSDDWDSGFNGLITIENLSDRPVEAWKLGFDANFEISSVWNAQMLSSDNNSYSVSSNITTTPIGIGETKTFGFAASKDVTVSPEISNVFLSQVVIDADLSDSGLSDDSSSEYNDDSSSTPDDSSDVDSGDDSSESDSSENSDDSSDYEEPVERPQTYTYEVRNEDCAVDEITVAMETAGDLEGTTTVESIMDKDVMCSGVVGLFGEPFDIETSAEFSSAVLTFKVDKSMLGDTEFDNLMFLWYDEENQHFVELDTEHDEESSTVSTTVTHFSKYMLVDAKEWFENWNSIAEFMRTLLHPTSTGICISCSDVNDPLFNCDLDMIINGTASIETPNNYRKLILAQLIEILKPGDLMFHIYGQTSRYGMLTSSSDLTDDKDALMTLDYQCSPSVEEIAGILIESHDKYWGKEKYNVYNKRTVIITDHDMSVDFEKLNPYYHYIMEIPVYFFCIGDFETPGLQNIVDHCGGDIYKVTTLSEFTDMLQKWGADKICGEKDYDHDGFSDVEEINGLIYDQSGNLVYTDYQKEDSDDDGLYDWQEVEVEMTVEETVVGKFSSTKYYHKMHSNPMLKDSDGDNIGDAIDIEPMSPNTINVFSGDCYDLVDKYYTKLLEYKGQYMVSEEDLSGSMAEAKRACYRTTLDLMMSWVNACPRPDLVPDKDWLAFCKKFNSVVLSYYQTIDDDELEFMNENWYSILDEDLHYFRTKLNRIPSSFEALINDKENWLLYDKSRTYYHMNDGDFISTNPDYPSYSSYNNLYNLKFVDINGIYEVVVTPKGDISGMSDEELEEYLSDSSNWQIITDDPYNENPNFKYDPVNMGTYNYCAFDERITNHNSDEDLMAHNILDVYSFYDFANVKGLRYGNSKDERNKNAKDYLEINNNYFGNWEEVFNEENN